MTPPFDIELSPIPAMIAVPSALTPVRQTNVAEQVADRLVTAISLGEFVTGQRLPSVPELAALLAVNQTSIREALQRLAATGYVRIVRGRSGGTFVTHTWGRDSAEVIRRVLLPNWATFEHLFDLRRLTEPLIAQTAAQRYTEEDALRIVGARDAYAAAVDDPAVSNAADQTLHTAIAAATQNPYLVKLSLQLRGHITLGFQAMPYSSAIGQRAIGQHQLLVAGVLRRDPAAAAESARKHISIAEDALRALYDHMIALRDERTVLAEAPSPKLAAEG